MRKVCRRDFIKSMSICSSALLIESNLFIGCKRRRNRPNFVFILIDDMGWRDAGCYGSIFYETPNIDRLASEGMLFTDAYAASPVCSPTRASILTGKHPARVGITDWIPGMDPKNKKLIGPQDLDHLPLEEVTIAEVLKDAGYATGFFGKWHLGDRGYFPENQGFDINKGGHWAGQPASYFYPYKNKRKRWDVPGLEGGRSGEYLTDRLTDEAIKFIEKNRNRPFFVYLSHYAVHTPIQSKKELEEKYRKKLSMMKRESGPDYLPEHNSMTKQKQDDPAYAGMIQSVDESVGRIMMRLRDLNLEKSTIIIFMSDNGGLTTLPGKWRSPTSVVPLRAGKGWLYEGGIREPMIIKWPGAVKPGTICSEPVISMDFYPTILEMAGLPLMPEQHVDGKSLVVLLRQNGSINRKTLFFHYPHYHGSGGVPSGAVRCGDFKLIEWFEDGSVELYNLREDIGERRNLANKMKSKRDELLRMLHEWRMKLSAGMVRPNPYLNIKKE